VFQVSPKFGACTSNAYACGECCGRCERVGSVEMATCRFGDQMGRQLAASGLDEVLDSSSPASGPRYTQATVRGIASRDAQIGGSNIDAYLFMHHTLISSNTSARHAATIERPREKLTSPCDDRSRRTNSTPILSPSFPCPFLPRPSSLFAAYDVRLSASDYNPPMSPSPRNHSPVLLHLCLIRSFRLANRSRRT
jgi:hypothetical protein